MSLRPRIRVAAGDARGRTARPAPMAGLAAAEAYDAADVLTSAIASWSPMREHPDSELGHGRGPVTARARDLVRNNGFAAGAARREADSVVGASFRPTARPDRRALGLSPEQAREIGDAMDTAWREWADDPLMRCDAARTLSWGGLCHLAYLTYMVDGDALAVLHWAEDGPWRTRLRVLDPDLLSNPQNAMDSERLRGGVALDGYGAAIGYHFRRHHPFARWGLGTTWDYVPRETEWGRPRVVHFFDKARDGQTRGVSRFAAVAESLKMDDKHARVALQAAVLGALLGVYVRSPLDPETVADLLDDGGKNYLALDRARTALAEEKNLTMGGVRLPVLAPGDSIETVSAANPNSQFEAFEATVLRRVAAGLGTSYEQLAMDWSKVNYSSARAALVEIWRGWSARRTAFAQRFCGPIRLAVIEEAVDSGRVPLPGGLDALYANPAAWLRAKWIGPGRGFVDPVKEVQAAAMRVSLGLSTMEDEAAELSGADYAENLDQIAREIGQMPEGVLHPAQERFAELAGSGSGATAEPGSSGTDPAEYGIAVRAGAVTPQRDDEAHFRRLLGLPTASAEVDAAWAEAGGVRAPITIKSGVAEDADEEAEADNDEAA